MSPRDVGAGMVASIWLQVGGEEQATLRQLIAALAAENGTMPFEPHLTVCSIAHPTSETTDDAADYIEACRALPLRVEKARISWSTTVPTRAVVIDVENGPELRRFREDLRRVTGANELLQPHISLVYSIDANEQRPAWSGDEARLRAIAAEAEERLTASRFILERPILVAPEGGDWTKLRSWRTLRSF